MAATVSLGDSINGVAVYYSSAKVEGAKIDPTLLGALKQLIDPFIVSESEGIGRGFTRTVQSLYSINVSSASEPFKEHEEGGPHRTGKAIDISQINSQRLITAFNHDATVTAIVKAIQEKAAALTGPYAICENFGPHLFLKHGAPIKRFGHHDHIHLRVH